MNEKTQTEQGTRGLQRPQTSSEKAQREQISRELRKKILSIRHGHATGGYCESESLKEEEKKLAAILNDEADELVDVNTPDSRLRLKQIERELLSFSWKPKLVVAPDQ